MGTFEIYASLPLNPVTGLFFNTPRASRLKQAEERHQAKSLARAQLLVENSCCGYNPINGESVVEVARLVPRGHEECYEKQLDNHHDSISIKMDRHSLHY